MASAAGAAFWLAVVLAFGAGAAIGWHRGYRAGVAMVRVRLDAMMRRARSDRGHATVLLVLVLAVLAIGLALFIGWAVAESMEGVGPLV